MKVTIGPYCFDSDDQPITVSLEGGNHANIHFIKGINPRTLQMVTFFSRANMSPEALREWKTSPKENIKLSELLGRIGIIPSDPTDKPITRKVIKGE